MNDVFDEELMKELGLNADDVAATPKPGVQAPAKKPAPPAQQAQPQATAAPAQPRQPAASQQRPAAPRPPAGAAPEARPAAPRQAERATDIDPEAHARRMSEDLPVQMAAVLAKKSIALKDVIDMRVGEVIDFKKAPQEPLDLVANGKLIAKAELVLVDGKLGAKIIKLVK